MTKIILNIGFILLLVSFVFTSCKKKEAKKNSLSDSLEKIALSDMSISQSLDDQWGIALSDFPRDIDFIGSEVIDFFSKDKYEFKEFVGFSKDEKFLIFKYQYWQLKGEIASYKLYDLEKNEIINSFDSLELAQYSLGVENVILADSIEQTKYTPFLEKYLDIKLVKVGFPKNPEEGQTFTGEHQPTENNEQSTSESNTEPANKNIAIQNNLSSGRYFTLTMTNPDYITKKVVLQRTGSNLLDVKEPKICFSQNNTWVAITPAVSFYPFSDYQTGFIVVNYRVCFANLLLEEGKNSFKKKDFSKAISLFKTGLYLYPKQTEFYYFIACSFANIKDFKNASKFLVKTIELDPSYKDKAKKEPIFLENMELSLLLKEPS